MAVTTTTTIRLDTRISKELYAQIKRAAEIEGVTVESFLIQTLKKASADVIAKEHIIALSLEDQQLFADTLINPPKANKALSAATARYKEITSA